MGGQPNSVEVAQQPQISYEQKAQDVGDLMGYVYSLPKSEELDSAINALTTLIPEYAAIFSEYNAAKSQFGPQDPRMQPYRVKLVEAVFPVAKACLDEVYKIEAVKGANNINKQAEALKILEAKRTAAAQGGQPAAQPAPKASKGFLGISFGGSGKNKGKQPEQPAANAPQTQKPAGAPNGAVVVNKPAGPKKPISFPDRVRRDAEELFADDPNRGIINDFAQGMGDIGLGQYHILLGTLRTLSGYCKVGTAVARGAGIALAAPIAYALGYVGAGPESIIKHTPYSQVANSYANRMIGFILRHPKGELATLTALGVYGSLEVLDIPPAELAVRTVQGVWDQVMLAPYIQTAISDQANQTMSALGAVLQGIIK
jgi:hypothetical protein